MPSIIDELWNNNNNTINMNGHGSKITELSMSIPCNCCPFGYHIDRDFVPFSMKMLVREGDVQKIEELKEKWRSERHSMDKLLGIPTITQPWEMGTLTRPTPDMFSPILPLKRYEKKPRVSLVNTGVNTHMISSNHNLFNPSSISTQTECDVPKAKEDVGIQLNLDLESPNFLVKRSSIGSLSRRKRDRMTFETGIQVNEGELLNREQPPPLTVGVEKNDFSIQTDIGNIQIELTHPQLVPTLMENIGVNVKPVTKDFGNNFKPMTRTVSSNTDIKRMTHKSVETGSYFSDTEKKTEEKSKIPQVKYSDTGINTELELIGENFNKIHLESKETITSSTQTDTSPLIHTSVENVGTQFNLDLESQRNSFDSVRRKPLSYRNRHGQESTPPKFKFWSGDYRTESNTSLALAAGSKPKPSYLRSNTYTKEEDEDENVSNDRGEYMSGPGGHLDQFSAGGHTYIEERPLRHCPPSIDLSIPTIPEKREAVKPTKEILGALKVVNDSIKLGKDPNMTKAIKVIALEWFKIAGSKSANAYDVEDYLDLFESYSTELLQYIVNMPDVNGNTAMHYTISHGNFDVVSALLNSNCCDVNRSNKAGYTCIMLLSLAKLEDDTDRQVVRRLCNMGDVNIKALQHGQTALMLASSQGHLETCRILLEAGADINIQDDDGSTALMCAAEHGHTALVHLFLSLQDCNLELKDNDGCTALNVAVDAKHNDIAVTIYAHMRLVEPDPVVTTQERRRSYPPSGEPIGTNSLYSLPTSTLSKEQKFNHGDDGISLKSQSKNGGGGSSSTSPTTTEEN